MVQTVTRPTEAPARRRLAAFARDEEGGLIIFSLFLFVCMMLAVGIAIDTMRTEMARTRLQNIADNAVLAAASMEQSLDPRAVVEDYFSKAGLSQNLENVTVTQGVNHKTVTAQTNTKLPMFFLGMVGVTHMEARSSGTATAGYTDVEVSMVLDISGSMRENSKMANLRNAAKDFVDAVIDHDDPGAVSVSLVPYTAQVNAGSAITDRLNVDEKHSYTHCLDFAEADFGNTGISLTEPYEHMQHFQHYSSSTSPIDNPGCPQEDFERIVPFSENTAALKATINQYTPRANTAIHLGMKWGVALLDPGFRPVIAQLAASGEAGAAFGDRPYAWDRDNTMKVVVLMTDGQNVDTLRMKPHFYDSPEEIERWHLYSVSAWANYQGNYWGNYIDMKYTSAQADAMLLNICDAAKARGITIFSVGLEVTTYSASLMRNCASTPSHYFDVEGTEISDAFSAIARQISTLRLLN